MAAPATLNVCEPLEPAESVIDWPKPAHMLPFQPSPHESVIERVHVAPIATVAEPDHNGEHPTVLRLGQRFPCRLRGLDLWSGSLDLSPV